MQLLPSEFTSKKQGRSPLNSEQRTAWPDLMLLLSKTQIMGHPAAAANADWRWKQKNCGAKKRPNRSRGVSKLLEQRTSLQLVGHIGTLARVVNASDKCI